MKAVCLVAQGPHCFTKHIFKDFSGPHVAFLRTLLPGLNNCRHENNKITKKISCGNTHTSTGHACFPYKNHDAFVQT